ncbi:fucolectin-like [Carassius auratus]|uniref:Fucolectin-like n=1 Tax=Carassius auratus TaxID=7957 RepID=A0A6P6NKH8_CARAU|nr:fucolectin-like [Carassius auratus]
MAKQTNVARHFSLKAIQPCEEFEDSGTKSVQVLPNGVELDGMLTQSKSLLYESRANSGAAQAIDGIRYASGVGDTYCSITSYQLNPWWRLDLLDSYYIYKVTVTNRGDDYLDQTTGVEIRIGNSLENNGNNNPRCGVTSLAPAGSSVSFSCGGMEGRYVNMYVPNIQRNLALCEVEVYGTDLAVRTSAEKDESKD